MFLVTDLTGQFPQETTTGDVKDVADVIIGITGDEREGERVEAIIGQMKFGDEFLCPSRFKILCFYRRKLW